MKHKIDGRGLLLTAHYRSPESEYLVVSVGLLADCTTGAVFTTEESWEWVTQRFAGTPFDRGLKKSVGTFAVHGEAFALTEVQRTGMEVRVRVGPREKRLYVFAPRAWHKSLLGWSAVSSGQLEALPLSFENTFGGAAYPDNPLGQGYLVDATTYAGGTLAPIESADCPVLQPCEHPLPATFLPLPPYSSARTKFIGTLDERWAAQRAPWPPLDVDARWFNEVAQDQCHERYWRGDEAWSVTGMHPSKLHIGGVLPGLRPRLFVEYRDSPESIEEAFLDLDTLWLFPDAERMLLIYRVQVPVSDPDAEDIAALGLACELRDDPRLSASAWINHLWPCSAPTSTSTSADTEAAEVAAPEWELPAICRLLQADADRVYDSVAEGLAKSMDVVKEMSAKMGLPFDSQQVGLPARPNIVAMVGKGEGDSTASFDAIAHEATIRKTLAQAEACANEQVERLVGALTLGAQLQHAKDLATDQVPLTAMDATTVVAHLPLVSEEKTKLQVELASGLARVKALEADINAKVDAVREQLAAGASATATSPQMNDVAPVNWTREQIQASHAAGMKLVGLRFVGLDLSALDLVEADLSGSHFERCQLQGGKFNAADMRGCMFTDCTMNGVWLRQARLDDAVFQRCCLDDGELEGASFQGAYIEDSSFVQAQLTQVNFSDGQFSASDFRMANLRRATLSGARFLNCMLDSVYAANADMVKSQLQGCTADKLNINGANLQGALLSQLSGREISACGANLDDLRVDLACQLPGSCFDQANLSGASLQAANLKGSSLRAACLDRALISQCDLSDSDGYHLSAREADFTGSNLSGARWVGANLMDARLRKVVLNATDLSGSNLHAVFTDAARGTQVRLDHALMTQCRLVEDLARG